MTPRSVRSTAIRALLATTSRSAIGERLGMLDLVDTRDERRLVGHLGPDLLGADWDPAEAAKRLRSRPARPIGAALLDQRNLAGLGTIWTTETLFARRVSPWSAVEQLSDEALAALLDAAHRLLRGSVERTEWADTAAAYGHVGEPCPRCGRLLRNGPIADAGPARSIGARNERTLVFCPGCQTGR